jgi:hypothetical protein
MASQGDPTQPRQPAPPPPPPAQPEGIDLTTLFLSAVASAAAAYVTSRIWAPGTLFSAAMSPVIVALVKEGLRKPTEVVTSAVPSLTRPSIARGSAGGAASAGSAVGAPPPSARHEPLPDDLGDHLEAGAPPAFPPPQPGHEAGPVRVYSTRGRRLRWRLAVVTGLLGFGICVVLYTVPEIIRGKSVNGSGRPTTLFSTHRSKQADKSTTTTTTTTTTTAPQQTTTTAPRTTTEPTQTVTQTVTTPADPPLTGTTPAPAPQQTPTTTTPPAQPAPPAP